MKRIDAPRPKHIRQGRYKGGNVTIEDAGPPPEGPIVGFHKVSKRSGASPEKGDAADTTDTAKVPKK